MAVRDLIILTDKAKAVVNVLKFKQLTIGLSDEQRKELGEARVQHLTGEKSSFDKFS
jgi:hypothetical protein